MTKVGSFAVAYCNDIDISSFTNGLKISSMCFTKVDYSEEIYMDTQSFKTSYRFKDAALLYILPK